MFVKDFVELCQSNFGIAHDLNAIYAVGPPANVPFYFMNEKIIKITLASGNIWVYI